eukprot:12847606-Alexandrium_andersonii.AAC.1
MLSLWGRPRGIHIFRRRTVVDASLAHHVAIFQRYTFRTSNSCGPTGPLTTWIWAMIVNRPNREDASSQARMARGRSHS